MDFDNRELVLLVQILAAHNNGDSLALDLRERFQIHLETKGKPRLGYHEVNDLMGNKNPFLNKNYALGS